MRETIKHIENNIKNKTSDFMTDYDIDGLEKLTACLERLKNYKVIDDIPESDIDDKIRNLAECYLQYFNFKQMQDSAQALIQIKKFVDIYLDLFGEFWTSSTDVSERNVLKIIQQKLMQYK